MHHRPPPPLFVVPPELTAHIKDRQDDPRLIKKTTRWKKPRKFGPVPKFTAEERRRRHIKRELAKRHNHHLDNYIDQIEERLAILKEIRNERDGESGHERDRCIAERQD